MKKNSHHKFCSQKCSRENGRSKYNGSTLGHISKGKIGSISELEICAHYLREGYEVFRNVAPDGPADVILWKPETGELHIIDVKSYVKTTPAEKYIEIRESENDYNIKIVPYDYNKKEPLREI